MPVEHLLFKCFEQSIFDRVPCQIPIDPALLFLQVLMRLVEVLRERGGLQEVLRLLDVVILRLLNDSIFEVLNAVQVILLKFVIAEVEVDLDGLLE